MFNELSNMFVKYLTLALTISLLFITTLTASEYIPSESSMNLLESSKNPLESTFLPVNTITAKNIRTAVVRKRSKKTPSSLGLAIPKPVPMEEILAVYRENVKTLTERFSQLTLEERKNKLVIFDLHGVLTNNYDPTGFLGVEQAIKENILLFNTLDDLNVNVMVSSAYPDLAVTLNSLSIVQDASLPKSLSSRIVNAKTPSDFKPIEFSSKKLNNHGYQGFSNRLFVCAKMTTSEGIKLPDEFLSKNFREKFISALYFAEKNALDINEIILLDDSQENISCFSDRSEEILEKLKIKTDAISVPLNCK